VICGLDTSEEDRILEMCKRAKRPSMPENLNMYERVWRRSGERGGMMACSQWCMNRVAASGSQPQQHPLCGPPNRIRCGIEDDTGISAACTDERGSAGKLNKTFRGQLFNYAMSESAKAYSTRWGMDCMRSLEEMSSLESSSVIEPQ
jgi:hypothetical protein